MTRLYFIFFICCFLVVLSPKKIEAETLNIYWFMLHRRSNIEFLYFGNPGKPTSSILMKVFPVKTGMQGRPTPLPRLLGKEYWEITHKSNAMQNPETAPYFLTLNIPAPENEPYGPSPYLECNGQCNWILPGEFGLHGTGGDPTKLSNINEGSSGCIRHLDKDITYLYRILSPEKAEIRYYVEDI